MNNYPADDSTSSINNSADDLTSPSNNAVDDSTSNPDSLSRRVFAKRNTSNTSAAGRGVGRGQNISGPSNQTTSASIGQRSDAVLVGLEDILLTNAQLDREKKWKRKIIFSAPNDYERLNDGCLASFIVDLIDVEGGSPYNLFNRYAEYVLRQRIQTLECERECLRAQYQRLLCCLRQE